MISPFKTDFYSGEHFLRVFQRLIRVQEENNRISICIYFVYSALTCIYAFGLFLKCITVTFSIKTE